MDARNWDGILPGWNFGMSFHWEWFCSAISVLGKCRKPQDEGDALNRKGFDLDGILGINEIPPHFGFDPESRNFHL